MARVKQLTSAELRRLIKAHNKLVSINIPVGTKKEGLIKLIEDNGYKVDHENKKIVPNNATRSNPTVNLPPAPPRRTKEEVAEAKKERRKKAEKKEEEAFETRKKKIETIKEAREKAKKKKEETQQKITQSQKDLEKRKELKKIINDNKNLLKSLEVRGKNAFDFYNKEVTEEPFQSFILDEIKSVIEREKEKQKTGLTKDEANDIVRRNTKLFGLLTATEKRKLNEDIKQSTSLLSLRAVDKPFFEKFRKESKDNLEAWKKLVSFAKKIGKSDVKPEKPKKKEEPKKKAEPKKQPKLLALEDAKKETKPEPKKKEKKNFRVMNAERSQANRNYQSVYKQTPAKVLGVSARASPEEIKKAFRKFLKFHPDKHPPSERAKFTELFTKYSSAYDALISTINILDSTK